ncbi:hypothetical protein D9619_012944 [Psilocybe cf. subviscida]|uniref:Nephrocystin 3-like N-terminal domain-containing protein n=1 Tax=Psilocybe cf. subviscida TaxID=2480587 RepID=A0A8H5BI49_9AGAR|nr:hypothetical protein D9619_012944 [Psilocybe cf. subviscida]
MSTFSFGSHSLITGGVFTQVTNNVQPQPPTPWDLLQSAVAPAAFHNSAERFDSPRCHPNTRVAVMNELRDLTLLRGDIGKARILWLSGPAGAGKSAIAQTFCEECFSTKSLLASFFFNRSDPSRNTTKSFVTTLAYQIYGKVPANYQSLILRRIDNDPLVFGRSVDAQFQALIIEPLHDLFRTGYFGKGAPTLIVIDGLDECSVAPIQVGILSALEGVSKSSPFVFLVTSRPEHDIQMYFKSSSLGYLLHRLNLDNSYLPDVDIELFLREKMREACSTHPLRGSIPQGWPASAAIQTLVEKSSGQFIYASVAIQYVTSNRHYPPNRLEVVLRLRPPKRDLPFAQLDALYSQIFSAVEDVTLVLRILRIVILFQDKHLDILTQDIERLCELDMGECLGALCDLQSVLEVGSTIHLLHKSLPDYLQDPTRSHHYYIDTTSSAVTPVVTQCLQYISDPKLDYNPRYSGFILGYLDLLLCDIQLFQEHLMSFSLINCQHTFHENASQTFEPWLMGQFLWFAFMFLDQLCVLEGTDYEHVYYYHLHQFRKLCSLYPHVYGSSVPLENQDCIFPMIVTFILLGKSDSHIPPEVFELLQILPFDALHQHPIKYLPLEGFKNLPCSAARRCINSLMHDSNPQPAAFALAFLPVVLRTSRLSHALNDACLPGKPFAYAATGDHGLSALAIKAYAAMREYRERYASAQVNLKE